MSLGIESARYETREAVEELEAARKRHPEIALASAYPSYGRALSLLQRIYERGKDAGAALRVYGHSVKKEPLFALTFGPEPRGALTPTTVVLSVVHPMEWIGLLVQLALLDRIASTSGERRSIVCIPIVNPDGFLRVEENLRRKKRRFIRHNARGVDLNRNFDASWGKLGIVQRLLSPIFAVGARAASEPEVSELCAYLSAMRIDRALSLHSFGGAVLYPEAASRRASRMGRAHRARRQSEATLPRGDMREVRGRHRGRPRARLVPFAASRGLVAR
jgi:hypothetical protein